MNNKNGIARLGKIMQMAWVPKDYDAALRYWTQTMGVGPFFEINHIQTQKTLYQGAPADIDFSVAIAYWGDMQIEIIRQHNDTPSIYKAWLDAGREGLHHVCVQVDMSVARQVCVDLGAKVQQEIWLPDGGEAIYVDAGEGLIEMIDFPHESLGFFEQMKAAARDWDGRDAIRVMG